MHHFRTTLFVNREPIKTVSQKPPFLKLDDQLATFQDLDEYGQNRIVIDNSNE
jgi:hypothetical protein